MQNFIKVLSTKYQKEQAGMSCKNQGRHFIGPQIRQLVNDLASDLGLDGREKESWEYL